MTRPASHRRQTFDKCCQKCKHCALPEYKDDPLCFYGDNVRIEPREHGNEAYIELDGEWLGGVEGEAYDPIWGGRVIFHPDTEVCNNFEPGE